MNWLDIAIIALMAFAVWEGWRQGLITQVLGLAALVAGIFLGWKYGAQIGGAFGLKDVAAAVVGFVLVLLVAAAAAVLTGRLTRGLFRIAGLGVFDNLLGVLFSLLKMCIVTGIILTLIGFADPQGKLLKKETVEKSVVYPVVMQVAGLVFPYMDSLTGNVFGKDGE